MSQRRVLLFDIDGTLITTGGAGRKAMERAFGELHQRPDALTTFRLDGMTDKAIVRIAMETIGAEVSPEAIDVLLARYLLHLEGEVAKVPAEKYRVHHGMHEAVAAAKAAGAAIGLGTGNIKEGARLKLQRVGIYDAFLFGVFGDDHEHRHELIRRGAQRGVEHLKLEWDQAQVIVIGDTPKDIAAAQAIGARCIAVATGAFSVEQLREAGADWAFTDLTEAGALEALLDG